MPKRGKLRDIKTQEISMVDRPANKLPFVFFKRDGAGITQFAKAKKKITIEIESNGLVGGTKVKVNGDDLGKLRSFDFSFYGDDPKQPIHASYSKVTESVEGFNRTETYYLSKGEIVMDSKTLKALQEYLGTEDIDFEKKVDEEQIQKAMELITEHYKDDFPEDLEKAVGVLAKCASGGYEVKEKENLEKAGARFSKDTLRKISAVIAAVEALKNASELKATQKNVDEDDSQTEELAGVVKQLAELKESIGKLNPDKESVAKAGATKLAEALESLSKGVESVSKRVEAMEKAGVEKTGITDQDTDTEDKQKGAGKDGKVLWPSLA